MLLPWQQFFITGAFLIKLKFPVLTKNHLPPQSIDESYDNMGTCLLQVGPSCLTLEFVNGDIWFLDEKRLEPK